LSRWVVADMLVTDACVRSIYVWVLEARY
jgi:hypothetical protein